MHTIRGFFCPFPPCIFSMRKGAVIHLCQALAPVCIRVSPAFRASRLVKSIEMLHVKELLGVTGYIRGGCSPIGMKKKFPTYIDETAILFDEIAVSAGMRGEQVILSTDALAGYIGAELTALTI